MSKGIKDPKVLLGHVLDCIELISAYTKGMTKKAFLMNASTQDAVVLRLMIIGEAMNNIPDEFMKKAPAIPVRHIVGMRNMLIHEYLGVDMVVVWDTVRKDLPKLRKNVEILLTSK